MSEPGQESTRERTERLLDEAEAQGMCLSCSDERVTARLRYLLRKGEVVRPLVGTYARLATWEALNIRKRHLHVVRAIARRHPHWVFCGPTAALVYGLAVSNSCIESPHVAESGCRHRKAGGITWHWERDHEFVVVDGLRVTTLERTVFDCMRWLGLGSALAIADSALRRYGRDRSWLEEIVAANGSGCRGAAQARQVASLADGRAESGGESIARARMLELGFAAPELQVEMCDPIDGRRYRVDFLWRLPGSRDVAGELDGLEKYVNPEMTRGRSTVSVMAAERRRESRLSLLVGVMRFSFFDAVRNQGRRLGELMEAFGIPRSDGRRPRDLRPHVRERRDRGTMLVVGFRLWVDAEACVTRRSPG